ncbi:hypothetical protein HB364_02920 [Pseudoflavitalea sp. X16]|uniref:hypothetical protein n=1 Tax=Paraflavitalea devenefica TaxID=2716334 RepID=UPI0014212F2C|nr:hypothetical protein [Paraflavitalea devenefica]NII24017.1 hypothetical protein [Paraflavitalea devenefica]
MAKQIAGLCFLEGTFDDLTFYKMDGQYYARAKSSLSSKRVKTAPEFRRTMRSAGRLARASKIGAHIYKALPPGWRQFWMYRSFTGEAFTLLKENAYTDEEVKQLLWKCYVEYWEQIKAVDPNNPIWQPKPQKIRKRRKYSEASIQRLLHRKDKYGRYKYPEYVKAEKQRIEREAREAWAKKCEEKKLSQTLHEATGTQPETPNPEPETLSTWHITSDGSMHTNENLATPQEIKQDHYLLRSSTRKIFKSATSNLEIAINETCNSS